MTIVHYTIAMLARSMWIMGRKYGKQGFSTPVAISFGCMLRNRVQAAVGGISWLEVLQPFEAETAPGVNPNDPALAQMLWKAEEIYTNQLPDTTDGALDYSCAPWGGYVPCSQVPLDNGGKLYF